MEPALDVIYLNKERPVRFETMILDGEPLDVGIEEWTYYRVRGGLHTAESSVQVCRVTFPKFEDIGTVIDMPFRVGKEGVPEELETLMQAQWGLSHSRSIRIGQIG